MITDELKAAVIVEATKLRKAATKEELDKLDFKTLNSQHSERCIYGQMTGNCWGRRSKNLLDIAGIAYSRNGFIGRQSHADGSDICSFSEKILTTDREDENGVTYFSAIENYIADEDAKNDNLIDFLQGRTDKLIL